jgi:hypothetical protein
MYPTSLPVFIHWLRFILNSVELQSYSYGCYVFKRETIVVHGISIYDFYCILKTVIERNKHNKD